MVALRARAVRHPRRSALPDSTAPDLAQEIETLYTELQLQYEELLMTQFETEALRIRYRDLFDFAPVGYCSLTSTGEIEEVNFRAAELLGVAPERLRGRRFLLFVAPAHRDEFLRFHLAVLTTGTRLRCVLPLCREDGTLFPARLEGVAVPDNFGGQLCRLVLLETDEYCDAPGGSL